jgi:uncharacterized protein (TIGR02145 family)
MKNFFLIIATFFTGFTSISQTVIQMKKEGGVSIIPCKVNGLSLSFIFDTGASDVTISLTEAKFMFKNGYLSKNDILGTSNYTDANGDISEGININLREIEIQGLKLYNVKAAIIKNMDAPLLLGQTAISKLGVVQLDLKSNQLIILSNNSAKSVNKNDNTKEKTCQDFEGNIYNTVKIGTKLWMAENLNVEYFQNGDLIQEAKSAEEWERLGNNELPAWCYFNNDYNNGALCGKLYNVYAVKDPRGLAPIGWHVATSKEWTNLINYLGGENFAFKKMMSKVSWEKSINIGTNESGFSALGCGFRIFNGKFLHFEEFGYWWSSWDKIKKKSWSIYLNPQLRVYATDMCTYESGYSVRCVKD